MSGIFGIVSRNVIEPDKYTGLEAWNHGYGDLIVQRYSEDNALIGIKPETLRGKESDAYSFVLEKNDKVGVVDAFVFSDKSDETSDESFIFTQIYKNGVDSIKDINGEFAGAIWDKSSEELLLFRDHMGVRPLFYYSDEDSIIFSSDIRGVTSIEDVNTEIDEDWLYKNCVGASDLSATDTEFAHIKCVPFGGYVRFKLVNGKWTKDEGHYWVPGQKKIRLKNKEEYTKELRRLVEDAIKMRTKECVLPIGAELSGGLDSGVVDLVLAKEKTDCVYYSWTPDEKYLPMAEKDERLIIKEICEKAGIECNFGGLFSQIGDDNIIDTRIPIGLDGKYKYLPYYIKYAFPNYINTAPIYETSAFMKNRGVKFIFTGHCGDEGISHRANPYELLYHHEYYRYLRLMFSRSSVSKHRIFKTFALIKENLDYVNNVLEKPFYMKDGVTNPIVKKSFAEKYKGQKMPILYFAFDPRRYIIGGGSRNRLDVVAFYGSCTGVRYIAPYVDYRVVDFALGIPRYLYHNWYYTRYIFREAFKDMMPESMYWLTAKESNSYKNLPKDDDKDKENSDEEQLVEVRKSYLEWLDKEYWSKYLDFDVINDWVQGKIKDENGKIFETLMTCIQAEHMVKRSREVET